jgi:acetamidase/formamidase
MLTSSSSILRGLWGILWGIGLLAAAGASAQRPATLQPLAAKPGPAPASLHTGAAFYVPATRETIRWGYLPPADAAPILSVPSGSVITFDTLSHEGMLEDQGRNPAKFFAQFGVPRNQVLDDAQAITQSSLAHDFASDGPHIIVGPVDVQGARPGDLLKVDFLDFTPRVGYGVISTRHGKGALPGEFPETPNPGPDASAAHPERFHNSSQFISISGVKGHLICTLSKRGGGSITFPANPFLGTVGLAPASNDRTSSIPPSVFGGNLDIHYLVAGTTLYLPVQVGGAKFFVSDPHFAQGNGEVSLTAVEGSLRATVRLTVLKFGQPGYPSKARITSPFAETPAFWIPIGLDPDLNEAMKKAVRNAIDYLSANHNMDRATALAYLSAATDFEVSQVVDHTKGVHGLIRKRDFASSGK